jgi:hypothetical protein
MIIKTAKSVNALERAAGAGRRLARAAAKNASCNDGPELVNITL